MTLAGWLIVIGAGVPFLLFIGTFLLALYSLYRNVWLDEARDLVLYKLGIKGKPCAHCGFSRAAHIDPRLERTDGNTPCRKHRTKVIAYEHA